MGPGRHPQHIPVGNTVAVQAGVQHGPDGRRQRGAGGVEQHFQPSVRSVLVALGVSVGLMAFVGTTSTVVASRIALVSVTPVLS